MREILCIMFGRYCTNFPYKRLEAACTAQPFVIVRDCNLHYWYTRFAHARAARREKRFCGTPIR